MHSFQSSRYTRRPQCLGLSLFWTCSPPRLLLRSRGKNILHKTRTNHVLTERSLSNSIPTILNSLPQTVISDLSVNTTIFKSRLKAAFSTRTFDDNRVTTSHLRFFALTLRLNERFKPCIYVLICNYYYLLTSITFLLRGQIKWNI